DGWAMESRLYAEDPYRGFLPSIGRLTRYRPPAETEGYLPGHRPTAPIIRNDTGVEEGGEISRFYDPMIAKLCTWGASRADAIEGQRNALDAFELEGIGHNLPFLAAVYDHPKFISGEISTAFIAEEYPDGFSGTSLSDETLKQISEICAMMQYVRDYRALQVTGKVRPQTSDIHRPYLIEIASQQFQYTAIIEPEQYYRLSPDPGMVEYHYTLHDGTDAMTGNLAWKPGATLARRHGEPHREGDEGKGSYAEWDGPVLMCLKVEERTEGFRIRYRGADLEVKVRSPRAAALAALMPEKEVADTSKMLLCPMPGVVVSLAVVEGEAVEEGQALCTVEAMKMENVLRAERKGTVKQINAEPGASLAVDDVIMEFE
ncbi:MAG: biotin/lipoyl-containing protein, partial [Pseudomonadota bacterium]